MNKTQTINNLKTYPVHTILSRPTTQNREESSKTGQELTQNLSQTIFTSGPEVTQTRSQMGPKMPTLKAGSPMQPKLAPVDDDEDFDFDFPTLSLDSNESSDNNSRSNESESQISRLDFTFSQGSDLIEENSERRVLEPSFIEECAKIQTAFPKETALNSPCSTQSNSRSSELKSRLTTTQRMVNPTEAECRALLNLAKTDPKRIMAERIIDQSRMQRRFAIAKKMLAMINDNKTETCTKFGNPHMESLSKRVK
jgi:hypothetical protein